MMRRLVCDPSRGDNRRTCEDWLEKKSVRCLSIFERISDPGEKKIYGVNLRLANGHQMSKAGGCLPYLFEKPGNGKSEEKMNRKDPPIVQSQS
jgi:hypothetical protein